MSSDLPRSRFMPSLCEKCVSEGGGCCDHDGSGIFVTFHDILRVHKSTGIPIDKFATFDRVSDEWLKQLRSEGNDFYDAYIDGKILQLRLVNKKCFFLGSSGCKIFDVRPNLCRMFPITSYRGKNNKMVLEMVRDSKIRKDEPCSLVKEHYNDKTVDSLLKSMGEEKSVFLKLAKEYEKETDFYDEHKHLLVTMKPSAVLKTLHLV